MAGTSTSQLVGLAFPLAFSPHCGLAVNTDGAVSLDLARTACMIVQDGMPLMELGSLTPLLAFEDPGPVTRAVFSYQIRKGLSTALDSIRVTRIREVARTDSNKQFMITIRDLRLAAGEQTFSLVSTDQGWVSAPVIE